MKIANTERMVGAVKVKVESKVPSKKGEPRGMYLVADENGRFLGVYSATTIHNWPRAKAWASTRTVQDPSLGRDLREGSR